MHFKKNKINLEISILSKKKKALKIKKSYFNFHYISF